MNIDRDVIAARGARPAAPELRSPSRDGNVYDKLLREAVTALTAAARLTCVEGWPRGAAPRGPCDWAEFVCLALAGAAANVGSIETALACRPGSWEAAAVRNLLTAAVGLDEQQLLQHRTDPIVVSINVNDLMVDVGAWQAYDDACDALQRRYDDFLSEVRHTPGSAPEILASSAVATPEQEHGLERIAELEDRLEHQRQQDWAAYGDALATHIEAQVCQIEGLRVPVVVHVDVDLVPAAGQPGTWRSEDAESLPERLLHAAVRATPVPGHGRTPLERLEQAG